MSVEPHDTARALLETFVSELQHWRDAGGLSQKRLAAKMGYSPSYISKIESGQVPPTADFVRNADEALRAGGAIVRRWQEYDLARRHHERPVVPDDAPTGFQPIPSGGIVVEHDDAELSFDGRMYRATQRRKLLNAGTEPVTRYLMRISVDRYPGDPVQSNQLYREHPLTWDELGLTARLGDDEMAWKVKNDRDAVKEVWLLFENAHGRFPLYPGESAWIQYSYTVGENKWGTWFQRAVRLPTKRLSVQLVFPTDLEPVVWGMETSMTAEAFPLRTAISQRQDGDRKVFAWATDDPPLHARYRLEWSFRGRRGGRQDKQDKGGDAMGATTASQTMSSLGIVQAPDPLLHQVAEPFDLPAEAEDARRVITELQSAMGRVSQAHVFGKGMGVAAPQIGIGRAAAIVQTPDGEAITLLNPTIIDEATETDEQYEGCLSFFDVRGTVPRGLAIQVEHQGIDGQRRITIFERGVARLVAHEVDHLNGILYTDRMRPGVDPIPVSQYRGTGTTWRYTNGS